MEKKCTQCKKEFPLDKFMGKNNATTATCVECRERSMRCRVKHLEKRKESTKAWKEKNKDYIQRMNEFYRTTTSLSGDEKAILWVEFKKKHNIQDKVRGQPSQHRKPHYQQGEIMGKDCSIAECGWNPLQEYNYNRNSWDKLRTTCKKCVAQQRVQYKDVRQAYYRSLGAHHKLRNNISARIKASLEKSEVKKDLEMVHYLGCSIQEFKQHIESKFTEGMTWEKYGSFTDANGIQSIGFHIDHIIPCKAFDFQNPQEILLCFHWRNCQPMWGIENMRKGARYDKKDKLRYVQSMETVLENVSYEKLVKDIERDVSYETEKEKTEKVERTQKEKQQRALYQDYVFDQALQDVQVMFFFYENPPDEKKVYQETLLFRMKNMQSRKRGEDNKRSKKVCQLSLDGEHLNTYASMNVGAKENGTYHSVVSKCCSNPDQLYKAGGYYWCFLDHLEEFQQRIKALG